MPEGFWRAKLVKNVLSPMCIGFDYTIVRAMILFEANARVKCPGFGIWAQKVLENL